MSSTLSCDMNSKVALRFFLLLLSFHLTPPRILPRREIQFSVSPSPPTLLQTQSCLPHQKKTFIPCPASEENLISTHGQQSLNYFWKSQMFHLSWSEHDAYKTRVWGSIPILAIYLRAGLHHPSGSFPTQTILWFYGKFHRWQSASNAAVITHFYHTGIVTKKIQILNLQDN